MNYILIPISFLLGSIPFGLIFAKIRNVDIQSLGSGNIGATNVARFLGWKIGLLTFALDFLKGVIPTYLGVCYTPFPTLVGIAAVLGHIFNPWMRFEGGKGISTAAGVFMVLVPKAFFVIFGIWIVLFLILRIVSVGSIVAAISLPIFVYVFYGDNYQTLYGSIIIAIIVVIAHRDNIRRLLKGKEREFRIRSQ